MADTIEVIQGTATVVEVAGPTGPQGPAGAAGATGAQGPQGVPGTGLEVLTTQGDLLYQGAATGERLPIGTTGQVLKVSGGIPAWGAESGAVSSVAGKTGAVTLDKNDVGLGNVSNTAQVTSVTGTAPIASSGGTTPAISITAATTSAAGSMSSADKTKLDGIASGAEVNVQANWTEASSGSDAFIQNKPTLGGAAALNVGTTTGTVAAGDDARLSDTRDPNTHAASHAAGGSDPVFDQHLNTGDSVEFNAVTATSLADISGEDLVVADANGALARLGASGIDLSLVRTNLGLGSAATSETTDFADASHTHELDELDATGATNGHVLTADGSNGASWQAAAGGGVTAVNSTLADILSVSGSDLVADDLGADKLYGFDDSEGKAIGFTIGSGLSVSGDTLSATASGGSKTYAVFTATDNQPPASAFATLDTRNSIAVLDFDDATDESAVFVSIIPEGASLGSGLKIRLHWMATTATSGNVVWDVSLERMTTDLDSDSFDTIASGTAAANGTSGILTVTEITLTTIDSVTAGDGFRLKVTRDANNASDTMTGDAELVVCEVRSAA